MFANNSKGQKCGMSLTDILPPILHGAILAAGVVAIGSFVRKRLRRMNKHKLGRDLRECKEDVVAFAHDACDEVCECMTDDDRDTSCGCEDR